MGRERKEMILRYVTEYYVEHEVGPSFRNIADHIGCPTSIIEYWVTELERDESLTSIKSGLIKAARSLRPTGKADIAFHLSVNGIESEYIPLAEMERRAERVAK